MRSRGAVRSKASRLRTKKRALTETEKGWLRDAEQWLQDTRKSPGRPRKSSSVPVASATPIASPTPTGPHAGRNGHTFETSRARFGVDVGPVVPPAPQQRDRTAAGKAPEPKAELPGWHDEVAKQAHAFLLAANAELARDGLPQCPSAMLSAFPEACARTLQRRFPQVKADQSDVDAAVVATCVGTTGVLVGVNKLRKRRAAKAAAQAAEAAQVVEELDDQKTSAGGNDGRPPEPEPEPERPGEPANERERAAELAGDLGGAEYTHAPAESAGDGEEFSLVGEAAET